MGLRLDLRQIVLVLSDALDLVGVDDVHHGKRVAYMSRKAGEVLGLADDVLDRVVHAGLFHDCGVSSTREHRNLAGSLDWDGEEAHCLRGEALVESFGPMAHLAPIVRWHHTHADRHGGIDAPAEALRIANLVYLADRVDVLLAGEAETDVLLARGKVLEVVAANRGTRFLPDLVDAFLEASRHEAFWLTLEPRALGPYLGRLARQREFVELTNGDLRHLAGMLATIVDAKSPYTAEHSLRVAGVARVLAGLASMDGDRCGLVEVAALLHDIGKLRVPDRILDKPGSLDGDERVRITRHAFDTWQILSRIDGFDEVARWAAYHHEWVSGGGYPFGIGGDELDVESRIVAVADVFQALRQDRPYRTRMPLADVFHVMGAMVASGKLDGDVVGLLERNREACEVAAIGV